MLPCPAREWCRVRSLPQEPCIWKDLGEAGVVHGLRRQVQVHVDAIVSGSCGDNRDHVRDAVEVWQELHRRAKPKVDLQGMTSFCKSSESMHTESAQAQNYPLLSGKECCSAVQLR